MERCLKKIMKNFRLKLSILSIFALSISLVNANIVYVDFAKADDDGSGLTWATAKKNIQAGINLANAGDEVWVAKGNYSFINAGSDYGINVNGKAIKIYGGLASGAIDISSRINSDRSTIERSTGQTGFRIITFHNVTTGETVFDGFELDGAKINIGSFLGGAIGVWSSGVTINNCVIKNVITGLNGAGIYAQSPITVTNCRISGNQTTIVNAHSAGGIFCNSAGSSVTNCLIDNNTGAGVANNTGAMTLMNCTIVKNKAINNSEGGVSAKSNESIITMTNCIIWGNEKLTQGLGQIGSAATSGTNNNMTGFGVATNCAFSWSGVNSIPDTWINPVLLMPGTTGTINSTINSIILQPFLNPTIIAGHTGYNTIPENWNLSEASACLKTGSSTVSGGYPLFDINKKLRPLPPSIGAFEPSVSAGTWYVNISRPDDTGDGLTWATAKKNIQAGINLANAGDTIRVANGTYSTATAIVIQKSDLTIQGGWSLAVAAMPVHQPFQAGTIIKGSTAATTLLDLKEDAEGLILEGVTFRDYSTTVLSDYIIKTVLINVKFKNCIFTNNTKTPTSQTGLIMQPVVSAPNKRLVFSGCSFINNSTRSGCFLITGSAATSGYDFENCVFANNSGTASGDGSVITLAGQAGSFNTIKNCTFVNNLGQAGASSIRKSNASVLAITNTVFFSTDNSKPQILSSNVANLSIINCYITAEIGKTVGDNVSLGIGATVQRSYYLSNSNTGDNSPKLVSIVGTAGYGNGNSADNFSLQSTSSLISAGASSGAPTYDIINVVRPNPPSVGAYQGSYSPAETGKKLFVHNDNGNDAHNGESWATAKRTIEGALLLSPSEIWVKVGSYTGSGIGNAYVIASGVKMYGGFVGTETDINERILTNKSTLNKSTTAANTRVLRLESGLSNTSRTIVDGFTITGGSLTVSVSSEDNVGAGVFMNNFTTLSNCTVYENTAVTGGGGIYMKGDSLVDKCIIQSNNLTVSGYHWNNAIACGGGVLMNSTSSTIRNSSILSNNSQQRDAGGIASLSGNIINCVISGNTTVRAGGGIYVSGVTNIINCLINNNSAGSTGGGIRVYHTENPTIKIVNCTIVKNTASIVEKSGGVFSGGTNTSAVNTVIWGNIPESEQWKNAGSRTNCASDDSNIFNVSTNIPLSKINDSMTTPLGPFFNDPDANDYQFKDESPLRNTGSDALYTIGDLAEDKDLAGNLRKTSTSIDIGAYESTSSTRLTYIPNFSSRVLPQHSPAFTITNLPNGAVVSYSIDGSNYTSTFPSSAGRYSVKINIGNSQIYEIGDYDRDFWIVTNQAYASTGGGISYGSGTGWDYAVHKDAIVDALNSTGYKTLWVAAGDYNITKRINTNFTGKILIGGFAVADTDVTSRLKVAGGKAWEFINETTFSGPAEGDAQMFAITSGNTETSFDGITFKGNSERAFGGGILETTGSVKLINCIFKEGKSNNSSNGGGAIFAYGTGSFDISGCLFDGNTSKAGGGAIDIEGNGTMTITNSKFIGNIATGSGGGVNIRGSVAATIINTEVIENIGGTSAVVAGGIHADTSSKIIVTGCYIYGNTSLFTSSNHGGVTINGSGDVDIIKTRVIKNYGGSAHGGGAIVIGTTGVTKIINSIITNNGRVADANWRGAGILSTSNDSKIKVINCVVAYNDCGGNTEKANGITFGSGGQNELINTIVWGNTDCAGNNQVGGTYSTRGSAIQGLIFPGVYELNILNTAANGPNFVSVAGTSGSDGYNATANWELTSISPCIDKGVIIDAITPTEDILGYDRPRGLSNDIGAYEFFLKTIYVKTDGNDNDSGMSWANAKKTLQGALAMVSSGDQIWMAGGDYSISATQTIDKSVSIFGSFAGTEDSQAQRIKNQNSTWSFVNQTNITHIGTQFILSANDIRLDGIKMRTKVDNSQTGFQNTEGAVSVGNFTNIMISNCIITGFGPSHINSSGAGINIKGGRVIVENTFIEKNRSKSNGSGINIAAGSHIIRGCKISGNYNNEANGNGGGINVSNGVVIIEDTSVDSNYVIRDTDTGTGAGGGISVLDGTVTIKRCKISNNQAKTNAAGIYVAGGNVLVQSSLISNNYLGRTAGTNLSTAFAGGGFYLVGGIAALENCTIVNNHCGNGDGVGVGGGICQRTAGSISATNCLVWGNVNGTTDMNVSGSVTLNNCAVTGTTLTSPNINLNTNNNDINGPEFKLVSNSAGFNFNWETTNWGLTADSICNDAGTDIPTITKDIIGIPVPQGSARDIGAYETAAIDSGNFLTFNNLEQEILSLTPVTTSPINGTISYYSSVTDAEQGTNNIRFTDLKPGKWRVKAVVVDDSVYGSETAYADLYINENFDVKIGQDVLYVSLGKKEEYGETFSIGYGESWANPLSKKLLVKALDYANLKVCVSNGTYDSVPTIMIPAGKTLEGGWLITNGVGTRDLVEQSVFGDKVTIYPWEFKNPTIIKQSVNFQNAVIDLNGGIIDGITVKEGRCGVVLRNNGKIYNSVITNNQGNAGATFGEHKGIGVSVETNSDGNLIESSFIYDNKHTGGTHQNHAAAGIGLDANATMFVTVKNSIIAKNKSMQGTGGMTTGKSSSPVILNCVFVNNESSAVASETISSGGIGRHSDNNSNVRIENCTIAYNKTSATGIASFGGISLGGDGSNFKNNIVWGNSGGQGKSQSQQSGVSCAIQEMVTANINLATVNAALAGPNFINVTGSAGTDGYSFVADWRINNDSPCRDKVQFIAATTTDILGISRAGAGGSSADIGAYELISNGSTYLTFHNLVQYKDHVSPVYTSPIKSTIKYFENAEDALDNIDELAGLPTAVGRYRVKAIRNAASGGYPSTEEYADLIIIDNVPEDKDDLYVVDVSLIPYGTFTGNYGESWENPIAGTLLQEAMSKAKLKVFLSEGNFSIASTLNVGIGKVIEGGYNMETKKRDLLTTSEVSSIAGIIYSWEFKKKSNLSSKTRLSPMVSVNGILDGVVIENGGSGVTLNVGATLMNSVVKGNNERGVYVAGANTKILNNYITENGNTSIDGAGIYVNATTIITGCVVSKNSGRIGGGLYLNAATTVTDCIIAANLVSSDQGGAVKVQSGASAFVNCLVANNESSISGGYAPGFDIVVPGCSITNCSFVMNKCLSGSSASSNAGTSVFSRANLAITNSLFFGGNSTANNKAEIMSWNGTTTLQNCAFGLLDAMRANNGAVNNNDQIPTQLVAAAFVAPATVAGVGGYSSTINNWQLTATSPCIDSGISVASVKSDILGVARPIGDSYDVGAYEHFSTNNSYLVLHNLIQVETNITDVHTTPVAARITYYGDNTMNQTISLPSQAGRYYVKAEVVTTNGIFGAVTQYADLIINGKYVIPTDQDDLYVSVEGKLGYGEFSGIGYGKSWDNPIIGSQLGLTSAISNARKKIYIAGGIYNISSLISLPVGKTIEGGYNLNGGGGPFRESAKRSAMGSLLSKPSAVIYPWEFESPTIFNATTRLSPVIDLFGTLDGVTIQNGANGVWAKTGSTVTRSIIQNNEGNANGGNSFGAGIGIHLFGNVTVKNSLVFGNRSLGNEGSGGIGYGRSDGGTSNIYGSAVIANFSSNHGGAAVGAQIASTQNYYNCLFSNNAGGVGVILTKQAGTINVYYSTIVNNNTTKIVDLQQGAITLNNCLAYGNQNSATDGTINNCYGQIGTSLTNNPFAETSFTTVGVPPTTVPIDDAITKAYWGLNESATCIDKGTYAGIQPTDIAGIARPLGNGYDVGAYEYVPNNSKYMAFHNLNQQEGNVIPVITSPSATDIQYYLNMEDAVLGINGTNLPSLPGVYVVKAIMLNNANFPDTVQYANLMISPTNPLTVSIAQNVNRLYVTLLGGYAYGVVSTDTLTGASWESALPATHSQAAIDAVASGGEIWISFGTYFGASNNSGFMMRDDVSVYGGFYGDESNINERQKTINGNAWEFDYETILSGANPLGNSYSVVKFPENATNTMLLNGVAIENGYANVVGNNTGGGVYLTSNGVVDSCIIRNNRSLSNGGGIFINGGTVLKSLIQGNSADSNSSGGGVSVAANIATVVDSCFIVNNSTSGTTGNGGGIHLAQSNSNNEVLIKNSLIAHNNTANWGAGICADIASTTHNVNFKVVNCSIVRNLTTFNEDSRTGAQGVSMINTVIWGNVKSGTVPSHQFYACATTNCAYSSGNFAGNTESTRIELQESTNPGFTSGAQVSSAGGMIWLSSWDYSISSMASPLYNAGLDGNSNVNIPVLDILETIRPQGGKWDIGAYELIVDKIEPIYVFSNLVQQNGFTISAVTAKIQNLITGFEDPSTNLTVEYATIANGSIGTYSANVPNANGTYKVKIISPQTANFLEKTFILDMVIMPESEIIYVTSNVNDTTNATNNIGSEENPLLAKFFVNAVNLANVKTINLFSGSLIETANDDSSENSTIIIDRGNIADPLEINGATAATTRAVNTAETSIIRTNSPNRRIFEVKNNVVFKNIIFDGGPNQSFTLDGAGLLVEGANVSEIEFENCIIRNCTTTGNGGGLSIKSGNVITITNSSLLLNNANNAAAINFTMGGQADITLRNTFISGNRSQSRSYVINSQQPVKIIGTIFDNNTGVALNIPNGENTDIINCTFVKNESAINAVSAGSAYVKIINSIFWGNTFNFSVGGNGFFSNTVYDVTYSAIQGLPSALIENGAAKNNNVALSSVNGGDSYYRGPIFKAPSNDIGAEGYSANNSWRITDYSEALLNKGLEDDALNFVIPYYTGIGEFDIYGDARIGTDQDLTKKLDIGAAEKGSRSSTPAIDVDVAYKGELFSWSVGVEIGVAYYNVIDAKTGKIIATIMATGESHYEIIVPEGMDLYLQIIDINGFSQDFAPGDKTIGRIIYNLKQGWNLIAVPFANADISELANVSGNLFWKFENGIYSQHSMGINSIDPMKGIWIYCEYQRQIEISGKKLPISDVELQPGWNLFGSTNNILAPINVEIIFGWNNQYEEILKNSGVLIQGQGYWFFTTEKTIIKL